MNRLLKMMCVTFASFGLMSCSSTDISFYKNTQPNLNLEKYFLGKTEAWGLFQKRSGEVVKRFYVVIEGKKENDKLILDESFTYHDGSTDKRIWTLEKNGEHQWQGSAADVKGLAKGTVAGNAFHWQYTLLLPVDNSVYEMHMDDWMYLLDEKTLINKTKMRKLGFDVGEVTLFFKKP